MSAPMMVLPIIMMMTIVNVILVATKIQQTQTTQTTKNGMTMRIRWTNRHVRYALHR
jgi:hypothetical protein